MAQGMAWRPLSPGGRHTFIIATSGYTSETALPL
jgi:hypothetical protein